MASSPLVLGPMLRYTDETCAAVWVETDADAEVSVHVGDSEWRSRTFAVHGHHYALVEIEDLAPGSVLPYEVRVNAETVWPDPDSSLPASVIATRSPQRRLRMAWGSCRTSVDHDATGNRTHGVDAMRTFALALCEDASLRPDLILLLGDQVYADMTTEAMQEFIRGRRDISKPPGKELKDYEEYAHLYRLAWSDDANRWLLSTVSSAMIFDDHDVRDDWNASLDWKKEMEATSWWHGRIVAGLASYWVYQHLGNLSPTQRAQDEIWKAILAHTGPGEPDVSAALDALADRVDRDPRTYRFSYHRDFGDIRLIVVDSRCARDLTADRPGARRLDRMAVAGRAAAGRLPASASGDLAPLPPAHRAAPRGVLGRGDLAGRLGTLRRAHRGTPAPDGRPRALGGLAEQLPIPRPHPDRDRRRRVAVPPRTRF